MTVCAVVIQEGESDLLQMVHALRSAGRFPSRLHGRQQQYDQHRDDGDDHQQLYQRETASKRRAIHVRDSRGFLKWATDQRRL
jgi:hypothetical protein